MGFFVIVFLSVWFLFVCLFALFYSGFSGAILLACFLKKKKEDVSSMVEEIGRIWEELREVKLKL